MNEGNIISVQNVEFRYINDYDEGERSGGEESLPSKLILGGIDLDIKKGEFLAVLGHNGSGKSTLAKHLNAVLLPVSGKVYVDGIDTSDEDRVYDIRRRAGMVFQNPDNQIVASIVEEDVAFALENLGVPPGEMRERVDDALKSVDMFDYRRHSPHRLSGGQKQRVAIAGVIAMRPQCIVLDEPTAMLDPRGRREVVKTIRRLNREFGVTIVLITHYMDEAAEADRVVVMDEGAVVLDGTPGDVFCNVEKMKDLGLDVPQVTELMYLLGMDARVTDEDACVSALLRVLPKG